MAIKKDISEKIKSFSLLCAGMVVGIHVTGMENPGTLMWWWSRVGHYGVFLIAVPFFFMVSGYFLAGHFNETRWWRRECKKRVRSLLVPFIFWITVEVLILVCATVVANLMHGRELLTNIPRSLSWWTWAFGVNPFDYPSLVPIWYIRALMLFVLISPVLDIVENLWGAKVLICIYLFHLAICFLGKDGFHLFMQHTFSLFGLFYFYLGILIKKRKYAFMDGSKLLSIFAIALGGIVLGLSFCISDTESGSFWLCRMIFVPLFLFALWNLFPTVQLPQFLSSMSFPIFVIHCLVWQVLGIIQDFVNVRCLDFIRAGSLSEWCLKWGVGFCAPIVIAVILKKLLPGFSRLIFGGR